ncbi:AAA family ATPase [Sinorhizobium meliloti]|uniref:AAA family ATPase n=1 Tax=Rhizobium meliloti TaxID=382 RepID=UPI0013E3F382|nr:AAA family ATPase [Sinorhizobium meliloti]
MGTLMHRRLRKSIFKDLCRYPMRMLAYGTLQKAFRHSVEMRSSRPSIIICIVPEGARVSYYERAAQLLLLGNRQRSFDIDDLRTAVHVIDAVAARPGRGRILSHEVFRPKSHTIYLAASLDAVEPRLRFTADLLLHLEKPTPRQIASARRLSGAMPISRETVEALAGQSMEVIEVAIGRRHLDAASLQQLKALLHKPEDITPSLDELPGYSGQRAWVEGLKRDVADWKAGEIAWQDVDRGALISGPPGTGKTLFAKALAKTLGLKLVATSVGEWQSAGTGHLGDMVRSMRSSFEAAKAAKGAVLFVDELDSIGDRGNINSGYDYYEMMVVNMFLELTAGAAEIQGVIILGATNHPHRIDPAILRAGRLEKHLRIDLPTREERAEIVSFHLNGRIPPSELRGVTDGLVKATAADLERFARQARRRARSRGKPVTIADVEEELPTRTPMPDSMTYKVAVHEAGHALVALHTEVVEEVTVEIESSFVENGAVEGGRTSYQFIRDDLLGERILSARIRVCLAGMAAEETVLCDRSTGSGGVAGSDLEEATVIATRMVASYGMGRSLRFVTPAERIDGSHKAAADVGREVDRILAREYVAAKDVIESNRNLLEGLVARLIVERSLTVGRDSLDVSLRGPAPPSPA